MVAYSQEYFATDRREIVMHAIDGLRLVERHRGLNITQRAALNALDRILCVARSTRDAVITPQSMARPVEIAHQALEALLCAH